MFDANFVIKGGSTKAVREFLTVGRMMSLNRLLAVRTSPSPEWVNCTVTRAPMRPTGESGPGNAAGESPDSPAILSSEMDLIG